MTVKVYNIKELVETKTSNKYTVMHQSELAIIEGIGGVTIVSDAEAIHNVIKMDNPDKYISVSLYDQAEEGSFNIMPSKEAELSIDYITSEAKYRDVELNEFVRTFGSRIESNYRTLLKSIKEAGLNPNNYQRKVATNA